MAKPPKSFKLVNFDWTIDKVDQPTLDKAAASLVPPDTACGYSNRRNKTVLYTDDERQEIPRTILHEALHCCFYGLDIGREKEESVVTHLEERLTDLIKNNPKLVKYLQENL